MKFELDIVRFKSEDVVTASTGGCTCEGCEVLMEGDVL